MKSYSKLWGLLRTCVSNGRPFLEAGCDTRPTMTQVEGEAMLQTLIMILRTSLFQWLQSTRSDVTLILSTWISSWGMMDLLLFFANLYALFNIHFRPKIIACRSANPPSLPFSPPMDELQDQGPGNKNQKTKGLEIPISWWWAAYSKHIYLKCWGLQTTSLYDQTKHIWPKTEWTRGLFPQ